MSGKFWIFYLNSESGRWEKKEQVSKAIINKERKGEFQTDFWDRPETKENGPTGDKLEKGDGNWGAEIVITAGRVKNSLWHC